MLAISNARGFNAGVNLVRNRPTNFCILMFILISNETVSKVLGFDNTAYCNKPKGKNRKPERALVGWNWKYKCLQLIYLCVY